VVAARVVAAGFPFLPHIRFRDSPTPADAQGPGSECLPCVRNSAKAELNGIITARVRILRSGNVMETKVIGGHPILVTAAVDAVKKWEFDSADAGNHQTLEINFTQAH